MDRERQNTGDQFVDISKALNMDVDKHDELCEMQRDMEGVHERSKDLPCNPRCTGKPEKKITECGKKPERS